MSTSTKAFSQRSSVLTPDRMARIFRASGISVMSYQETVHRSRARFRVFNGGRRLGKSKLGGHEMFAQMVVPESYGWIVGPTMDLSPPVESRNESSSSNSRTVRFLNVGLKRTQTSSSERDLISSFLQRPL